MRKPHFFKVLLGGFAHQLRIPQKFTRHLPDANEECEAATLVGPGGGKWDVQLERTREGGKFAGAGWRRFAEEHSLKELEFLVFRYDGSMRFTVFVFDTSACEREDLLPPAIRPQPQGKCLPPLAAAETESEIGKIRIKEEQDQSPQSCVVYASRRRCHEVDSSSSRGRRRPVISREQRSKAEKAANGFTSPFPFCIKRMYSINVCSRYTLRFPWYFSQTHLPRRRVKLILRDPNGKPWVVHYIPSSRDRDRLSVGWSAFACGNNLEEGDFCVFELVAPVEMQVHIVRVIEEVKDVKS